MKKTIFAALVTALGVGGCTSAIVAGQASHPAGSAAASVPAATHHDRQAVLAEAPARWGSRPPRRVTPGAERHSLGAVCPHLSAALRKNGLRAARRDKVYAEYGIASGQRHRYRIDHLVPLDLDGSNSIRNLWPQRVMASYAKDRLDAALHSRVCAGQLSLGRAQRAIRSNWVHAYRLYVRRPAVKRAAHQASSPPPAASAPPSPAPSTSAASCYPIASSGNCYEPGEFCSNADHGRTGLAGDGKAIRCENSNGWRWEPA
jgi:hypothetical protein